MNQEYKTTKESWYNSNVFTMIGIVDGYEIGIDSLDGMYFCPNPDKYSIINYPYILSVHSGARFYQDRGIPESVYQFCEAHRNLTS